MRELHDALLTRWIGDCLKEWDAQAMARLSVEDAGRLVNHAISSGRALGLRYDEDLLQFARVSLLLGSGFETNPQMQWTREILDDWDPDVGERVARLEAEVLRRQTGGQG